MNEYLLEFDQLISEITQKEGVAKDKGEKRKRALEKAKTLEFEFTQALVTHQDKQALSDRIFVIVKTLHVWLDKLYHSRPEKAAIHQDQMALENACAAMIQFLRQHFSEAFNQQEYMPLVLWQPIQEKLNKQWQVLAESRPSSIDLIKLLQDIYQQQCKQNGSLTYYHADYWMSLLSLQCSIETATTAPSDEVLIATLIKHNFNHDAFTCFFIEDGLKAMDGSVPITQYWIEKLQFIERLPILYSIGLMPTEKCCKAQLKEAITVELKHAEQKSTAILNTVDPIPIDLTVAQFALWIRLHIETGIIKSDNHTETIRKISQFFQPRNQQSGSYNAIRVKYYTIDLAAKQITRERFLQMVHKINTYD